MGTDVDAKGQTWADRIAIQDLLVLYATALDTKAFERLDDVFCRDVDADYGAWGHYRGVDALRGFLEEALAPFSATQHFLANFRVGLDGDRATARTGLLVQHVQPRAGGPPNLVGAGATYRDALRRSAEGWRIERRVLDLHWQTGEVLSADAPG